MTFRKISKADHFFAEEKEIKPIAFPVPNRKSYANDSFAETWARGRERYGYNEIGPLDREELLRFLLFREAIARQAQERGKWMMGRFYNYLSGEDPDFVKLSGVHLKQALVAIGTAPPDTINPSDSYDLGVEIVRKVIVHLQRF